MHGHLLFLELYAMAPWMPFKTDSSPGSIFSSHLKLSHTRSFFNTHPPSPLPIFFPPSLTKKRTDAKYNAKPWVIPQCTDQYLRPVSWQLYQLKYISWPWVISPCVVAHTRLISNALLWQQLWPVNSAFHKYHISNTLSPALVKAWTELSSQLRPNFSVQWYSQWGLNSDEQKYSLPFFTSLRNRDIPDCPVKNFFPC